MDNFTFYSPTKIIFGRGAEDNAAKEITAFGGKRVLLHYGGKSAECSGLLQKTRDCLLKDNIYFKELGGAVPNPRLGLVREGIELVLKNNIDFILAVGGGSAIDSSKAIALGAADPDNDVWDFFEGARAPAASVPVGVILTYSASGSESSTSCVLTNETGMLKRGVNSDFNRPKFALLNPELTYSLDPFKTACGIVDIMMHTMDRYFSPTKDVDFVDRISEALLQSVVRAGSLVMRDPENYPARADLMWAGSISHNTLTGTGKQIDFAPHHIEHEISGKYDVAHGAGLAAIWGHWAWFVYNENIMKFAQYAVRVWNTSMDFEDPEKTALTGIERTLDYFSSLGMPINLKELGVEVKEGDIDDMANKAVFFGRRTLGSFKKLGCEEVRIILNSANG